MTCSVNFSLYEGFINPHFTGKLLGELNASMSRTVQPLFIVWSVESIRGGMSITQIIFMITTSPVLTLCLGQCWGSGNTAYCSRTHCWRPTAWVQILTRQFTVWSWANNLTSCCLSFLIYKIHIIICTCGVFLFSFVFFCFFGRVYYKENSKNSAWPVLKYLTKC